MILGSFYSYSKSIAATLFLNGTICQPAGITIAIMRLHSGLLLCQAKAQTIPQKHVFANSQTPGTGYLELAKVFRVPMLLALKNNFGTLAVQEQEKGQPGNLEIHVLQPSFEGYTDIIYNILIIHTYVDIISV